MLRSGLRRLHLDIVPLARDSQIVADGRVVEVGEGGDVLRFFVENPRDHIQRNHHSGQLYERDVLDLIRGHVEPGDIFVDVGANVGNHTIYAASILGARVIAFEPASLAHTILTINVALNDLIDQVKIHCVALSDDAGGLSLAAGHRYNSGSAQLRQDNQGEDVELVRGDDLLRTTRVHFIKIDVEGHEMQVLEGLTETIRGYRPTILIELDRDNEHSFSTWRERMGYNIEEVIQHYDDRRNLLVVPANSPRADNARRRHGR